MKEKEELRKQFASLIIRNILSISFIFIVCGIFIFIMVSNITFLNVNTELMEGMERIQRIGQGIVSEDVIMRSKIVVPSVPNPNENIISKDAIQKLEEPTIIIDELVLSKEIESPSIGVILKDGNGKIVNAEEFGKLASYLESMDINKKDFGHIVEVKIGKYFFRSLSFELDDKYDMFETQYVQLLINVDSERALISSYMMIITATILIGIVLSLFVSYFLSVKSITTIRNNLDKQIEFVQNASHELRTPLTIIQAKQELLLQEPNAKIIDKSEDIVLTLNETKRLSKLVKDLMMLTRADKKIVKLNKEIVKVDDYLTNIVTPYKEVAELQGKHINLNLKYGQEIHADSNKLYQLMIILLDNAIKYTEENDLIEVRSFQEGNRCVIEIADTGIGVSDQGLQRIFERFYREDKARNRETGGSGLGLSIASVIVNEHNGQIKASHNTPKGTVFTIRLPR